MRGGTTGLFSGPITVCQSKPYRSSEPGALPRHAGPRYSSRAITSHSLMQTRQIIVGGVMSYMTRNGVTFAVSIIIYVNPAGSFFGCFDLVYAGLPRNTQHL